jgi:hypothetical protein
MSFRNDAIVVSGVTVTTGFDISSPTVTFNDFAHCAVFPGVASASLACVHGASTVPRSELAVPSSCSEAFASLCGRAPR